MKKKLTGHRENLLLALYFLAASFAVLIICTRSSFLYPYNNWDDSNSYFTMGKCMLNGILPYRDVFDQKGPWLYFVYGLCSLISFDTFAGVFILEILTGAVCGFLYFRIFRLFLKKETSLLLIPFLLTISFSSHSFYWGGCSEELLLPFLLLPLYYLLKGLLSGNEFILTKKEYFISGLCAGVVLATKFTLLGFHFGILFVAFLRLFFGKSSLRPMKRITWFLRFSGIFLAGMILPSIPWIIYFAIKGGLDDMYRDYIYTNVFLYSSFGANDKGESLFDRVYNLAKLLYWLIIQNFQYFFFIIVGMFYLLFRPVRKGNSGKPCFRLAFPIVFFYTFIGIFVGGSHLPYYSLPLTTLSVSGFIALGIALEKLLKKPMHRLADTRILAIVLVILLPLSTALCFGLSMNRYYLSYDKEDVFLSRFSEDIARGGIENPTLLNIGCLDCGLYTAAGVFPDCYWFQSQTLPTDEVDNEQSRYIREAQTDYIVARDWYPNHTLETYELIDSFHQVMGDHENDYYLLRRK